MKFWSRFLVVIMSLAFAFSLSVKTAQAASKKRKKELTDSYKMNKKHPISGTNLEGRSGLFYGDTSEVALKNQVEGSLHVLWSSNTNLNAFYFPVGGHMGIDKDLEVSAGVQPSLALINVPAQAAVSYFGFQISPAVPSSTISSTDFRINGGMKYKIVAQNDEMPDFSVGGNLYYLTNEKTFIAMPEGACTYLLNNGLLLNGDLGVGISTTTYIKVDAGVGYPITPKISLIGEIGANQSAYTASMFAAGARFGLDEGTKVQALLGVPLNGGNVFLGAGIILASI